MQAQNPQLTGQGRLIDNLDGAVHPIDRPHAASLGPTRIVCLAWHLVIRSRTCAASPFCWSGQQATYRVKAFRSAAATVAALDEEELAARAAAGTLPSSPASATSPHGASPSRWPARSRSTCAGCSRPRARPGGRGGQLRAALRGDCHAHSDWSDGGSPIEEMALAAVELGHEYLVLTITRRA